jgi:hypothetical protein
MTQLVARDQAVRPGGRPGHPAAPPGGGQGSTVSRKLLLKIRYGSQESNAAAAAAAHEFGRGAAKLLPACAALEKNAPLRPGPGTAGPRPRTGLGDMRLPWRCCRGGVPCRGAYSPC